MWTCCRQKNGFTLHLCIFLKTVLRCRADEALQKIHLKDKRDAVGSLSCPLRRVTETSVCQWQPRFTLNSDFYCSLKWNENVPAVLHERLQQTWHWICFIVEVQILVQICRTCDICSTLFILWSALLNFNSSFFQPTCIVKLFRFNSKLPVSLTNDYFSYLPDVTKIFVSFTCQSG